MKNLRHLDNRTHRLYLAEVHSLWNYIAFFFKKNGYELKLEGTIIVSRRTLELSAWIKFVKGRTKP